jgi:hypothetical protein
MGKRVANFHQGGCVMGLERELETYRENLPNLLHDKGKFVLIHGDTIAGVWDTYREALEEGYAQFELSPFLVKRIEEHEKVHFIRQPIQPCPTSPPDSPTSGPSSTS